MDWCRIISRLKGSSWQCRKDEANIGIVQKLLAVILYYWFWLRNYFITSQAKDFCERFLISFLKDILRFITKIKKKKMNYGTSKTVFVHWFCNSGFKLLFCAVPLKFIGVSHLKSGGKVLKLSIRNLIFFIFLNIG